MKQRFLLSLLILYSSISIAQLQNPVKPTAANQRMEGFEQRKKLQEQSLVSNVAFRNVGPAIMSGRVVDVDVNPADPTNFYVAYASGGLWVTTNNGQSFSPLFDQEAVMTIGDIAVDWNHHKAIWVGTGENNSSRSSYSGTGIYKSGDGGKTWQYRGLNESHHIGKIILHPADSNILWVAVLGHLYSPNTERGIYKSTDGGLTWKQSLFVNDNTGAVDLIIDPTNPSLLYASLWQRERRAWNFSEAGTSSGIYKSMDGGDSWKLITGGNSGFPQDSGTGRIGITIYPGNTSILYASLDNQNHRKEKEKQNEPGKLTDIELNDLSAAAFLALDNNLLDDYLLDHEFPSKYTAASVKDLVKKGTITPKILVNYSKDANSSLFDTPVIGLELYRSEDAGKTWHKTHAGYLDNIVYTYGYYFGRIWVAPSDENKVYAAGVPLVVSTDGGKTFKAIDGDNTHGDHHALWVDPARPGHLLMGDDGGLHLSYDDGQNWFKANTPPVGMFYAVTCDMAKPYNVYGGLQDNGVWYGPSDYQAGKQWQSEGRYPYKRILGGDGMQVAVDTRDNNIVYAGFQFGYYYRCNQATEDVVAIKPKPDLGEPQLRFNWQTPICLSKHNQDILYIGANKVYRSLDKGDHFAAISEDLTQGGRPGDVAFGTLTTIDESPLRFGLLYTGSDDGQIHVTRDGGYSWTLISKSLPQDLWVSRVAASAHSEGRVYVSLNGYRSDHFNAYLYMSDDYGANWKKIDEGLPAEPVNVVREDPVNPNIIYVGTDHGIYVTLDRGVSWMPMNKGLPAVPVHDLFIHSRDHDLVAATHGRSIYIARVEELEKLTDSVLPRSLYAFDVAAVKINNRWGKKNAQWDDAYSPKLTFKIYVKDAGITTVHIKSHGGLVLREIRDTSERGLNFIPCPLYMDSTVVKAFEKEKQKEKKGSAELFRIYQADDGNYYLPADWYDITYTTASGISLSAKLEIQSAEKRRRR